MSLSLVFRADAGPGIGNGHVMRCVALAQACIARGMKAHFLSRPGSAALADRIVGAGCTLTEAPDFGSLAEDAGETLALCRSPGLHADWVIVDGYRFDLAYLEALASYGGRLAVIDDLASLHHYPADIVLNQNIDASRDRYRVKEGCRLLLGPSHALLRAEFSAWDRWRRPAAGTESRVLLTLGGGDIAEVAARVLSALAPIRPRLQIRLLGPDGPGRIAVLDAAAADVRTSGHAVELRPPADDMAAEMAWADIAIAGGGSTVWELAYMQTPALLLVLADNQRANVEGLAKAGIALNLGEASRITMPVIVRATESLIDDRSRRDAMSSAGRELVDGRGAQRVARAIMEAAQ